MNDYKTCSCCNKTKLTKEFRNCQKAPDKKQYFCKMCQDDKSKESYETNRKKRIEMAKKWQSEHPSEKKQYQEKWENKKKIRN